CFLTRSLMIVCFCSGEVSYLRVSSSASRRDPAGRSGQWGGGCRRPNHPAPHSKEEGEGGGGSDGEESQGIHFVANGGALRIGGGGRNPPSVIGGVGGAGPVAPTLRPAAEAGQAPPASPLLVLIEGSAQRAAEGSAPPL